ncbi:MAG: alpha/beta hydrolase [Nitratireductor sp.]|nr:alpha/beta hydrolase [Nitratireductor sp.]
MKLEIGGKEIHVATGGREHEPGRPWIVFLHGSGYSHLSWVLQTRAFAYDGWNVLAPDLPGHGLSLGEPPASVEEMAAFTLAVMDAAGADKAVLAGHSMGGLIALEIARIAPARVEALVLIGTAAEIPVNPALIEAAQRNPDAAIDQMNSWGYGPGAHVAQNTWPGANHTAYGIAVMHQGHRDALAQGLKACAAYKHGAEAAKGYKGRALCIVAELDRMTPSRNGTALASMLAGSRLVRIKDCGHSMHTEAPREVNEAMRAFLASA